MLIIKVKEESFPSEITINGQNTRFRFQNEKEVLEFGELFSELFTVYVNIPGKEEIKFEGKLGNYDYKKKVIIFDYMTMDVEDDDIDTNYNIYVNGVTMHIERYAEWIPDDLKNIFFIICKETLNTNNTNFIIKYREYENEDYVIFQKYK